MSFSIEYDNQPKRFLKKYDAHIVKHLITKIESTLPDNPIPHEAKSIVNAPGVFRIRIGDFRALYRVNHQTQKIVVFKIDKRERVYN